MSDAKKELKRLYDSIKESNAHCEYCSDSIDFAKIIEQFPKTEKHNCPDGVVSIGDVAYMLEHFEISPYREGNQDHLKQAQNTPVTKILSKNPDGVKLPLNPSIDNLCCALSSSTKKHMEHYNDYLRGAEEIIQKEKTSVKEYKFIFVIEEEGNTVIEGENFTVLDILECTEMLLAYEQIDGVIAYHHGRAENHLIAIDRKNLVERSKTAKRKHQCELLMYHLACNIIPGLAQEGNRPLDDFLKIFDDFGVSDSIQVKKKD